MARVKPSRVMPNGGVAGFRLLSGHVYEGIVFKRKYVD